MQALIVGSSVRCPVIEEILRSLCGYEVLHDPHAEAAWALYEEAQPELIILTEVDPEDLALARRIRASRHGEAIILLAMVQPEDEGLLQALLEAEVDDCIPEWADPPYLKARLVMAVRRSHRRVKRYQLELELAARVRQQAAVAELGWLALARTPLDDLLAFAVAGLEEALGVEYGEVLRYLADGQVLLLTAGRGWKEGLVGRETVAVDKGSQAGYTLLTQKPVVVEDLRTETRFAVPSFLLEHGVVSGISVVIVVDGTPYGVLGAHTSHRRTFQQDDINFLQAVANVLAGAVERHRAEEQLVRERSSVLESEARTRAILETTVDGIITIGEDGCIESFNAAAERIFGYDAEAVIGENVRILMPAPYRQEHDGYLQNYLETGHRKIIGIGREVLGLRKDGTVFPMDLGVSELKLADRRIFTGVIRDISERLSLEQEILRISEQERRRIGQDLHDGLGQMLTGIGLIAQNLARRLDAQDNPDADEVGEITALIREADQQARGLARGLIPVDLEATGLSAALRRLAVNAGRLFDIQCTVEEVGAVLIDDNIVATHLYRIAQEAVSNAVKHGRAGHVRISLASGDRQVRLRIHDDGVGFPQHLDEERRGMGVRIMHYRARVIGATLEIVAGVDGGTTVTCTLRRVGRPRYQAEDTAI